jgi:prevent-host-death family protein
LPAVFLADTTGGIYPAVLLREQSVLPVPTLFVGELLVILRHCIYHNYDIILTQTNRNSAMPIIKPISDLRNRSSEISKIANDSNEPIFITKNGEGDLVVMSMNHYSKLQLKLDLLSKLAVAQKQKSAGDTGNSLKNVMTKIRTIINEQK